MLNKLAELYNRQDIVDGYMYGVFNYINYFDLLNKEDHLQFFLRIFFPISIATFVTVLEHNKRKKLIKDMKHYLNKCI